MEMNKQNTLWILLFTTHSHFPFSGKVNISELVSLKRSYESQKKPTRAALPVRTVGPGGHGQVPSLLLWSLCSIGVTWTINSDFI